MGTDIKLTFWHTDTASAQHAISAVMAEMERINQLLSPYLEKSALSQVNKYAFNQPQIVPAEFFDMVQHAQKLSNLSKGAFDITFASVGFHYDYRARKQPTKATLDALLPAINYQAIKLNKQNRTIQFLNPDIKIDLGGIAKGYAVDNAIAILKSFDVEHASVSAGGDSYLLGDRAGRPWIIGIKHPRAPNNDASQVVLRLPLSDVAVSTSGDYERFFIDEKNGERIHHIINPKTGRSSQGILSVTILAPTGAQADPLSTTVFILGVKEGLKLVNSLHDVDAIIIDQAGNLSYSDGLKPQ